MHNKLPHDGSIKQEHVGYLHTDHLNTPCLATDSNRTIVWRWDSDAFGLGKADKDPDGDGLKLNIALRFPGQYYDGESGLHYNYYRDYDPRTGRYIESDPIGLEGGLNTYAYVGGNPLSFFDPLGLETNAIIFEGVGWGGSSFGHVATDINGTTYTYGPSGMTELPTSEYLSRNEFRNAVKLNLGLTPEQEKQLEARLKWQKGKGSYGAIGHNCGDPLESGLENLGYDLGNSVTPLGLRDALTNKGLINKETLLPRSPSLPSPQWYESAPWAGW